jgi:hypothetical protein
MHTNDEPQPAGKSQVEGCGLQACESFAERGWGEAQPQHAPMPLRLVLGTQRRCDLVAIGRIVSFRGSNWLRIV